MLALTPWGVGAAPDSDDARWGRLQPAPASKRSSTAEPIERSPAMFMSPSSSQAVIRCPSGGRDDLTRRKISHASEERKWQVLPSTDNLNPRSVSLHRVVRP